MKKDLHYRIFKSIYSLAPMKLGDYKLEVNSLTGEIIWHSKILDIYMTPYLDGDMITCHILSGDRYVSKESIDISMWTKRLASSEWFTHDFIVKYLDLVETKMKEWKVFSNVYQKI